MKESSLHTHKPHYSLHPIPTHIIVLSDTYIIKNCNILYMIVYRKTRKNILLFVWSAGFILYNVVVLVYYMNFKLDNIIFVLYIFYVKM